MKWLVLALAASTALTASPLRAQEGLERASFDCTKARSVEERMRCANDDTRRADAENAKAFGAARAGMSPEQAQALLASQRDFNAYLPKICKLDGSMPKSGDAHAEAVSCLTNRLIPRTDFLNTLKTFAAGPLRLEARATTAHRIFKGEHPGGWITDDAIPVLVGASTDVSKAFVAEIREIYNDGKPLIGGRLTLHGAVIRNYQVSSFDEGFVSILVTERVETGVNVPPRENALNFDLRRGRAVGPDDIFVTSDAWRKVMTEALKKELNDPASFPRYIDHVLDNGMGVNWIFYPDKIEVSWAGAQPPGENVAVPSAVVKPFLKPDSPWKPKG